MINPKDIHVLIAEDEPDLRDLLAAKFRVFGFQVATAHNGTAAWEKLLEDQNFHIVITDIRMPNGTGYSLLQKCKERNAVFPKVFLISAFTDHTEEELFAMGAEGFINKPFDTKVLLDVVRKSLLKLEDRWRPQNAAQPESQLKAEFPDLKKALEQEHFGMGRGGFYFSTNQNLPEPGSAVGFEVQLNPWTVKGTGYLKWSRMGESNQPSLAGVEVVSLEAPSSLEIIKWIESTVPKAYIPSPHFL